MRSRRLKRKILLPAVAVAAIACTNDGAVESAFGSLEITTITKGMEPDTDGYALKLDGGNAWAIGSAGQLNLPDISAGSHTIQLGGVGANCVVGGQNPRSVGLVSGETTRAAFAVTCSPTTGSIRVRVSTSGSSLDSDGYVARLNGADPGRPVASTDVATFSGIPLGDYTVSLTGIEPNCSATNGTSRPVTVAAGFESESVFEIVCSPLPIDPDTHEGVPFGTMYLENALLSPVQTGALKVLSLDNILSELSGARAKKARFVIKLIGAGDRHVKNPDGTFSYEKWKALMDGFKAIDFSSYIDDGTILGHYLIDEPDVTERWGGKAIPQSDVEAMAKYSKLLWPRMTTMVRALPSWLAEAPITYTYLDAGWAQYTARRGDPARWLSTQVAVAESKGLRLVVSMNVLDGGNGSSGIPGITEHHSAMSAAELRAYGGTLLAHPYTCGFLMWKYDAGYYGRADIQAAMADLSRLATNHSITPCH